MAAADCISLNALALQAQIGPDCWGRHRPQPVLVTVHAFTPVVAYAAETDDVTQTIHYGHLASALFDLQYPNRQFDSLSHLAEAAAYVVLRNPEWPVSRIRVIAEAPKLLLQAKSLVIDMTRCKVPEIHVIPDPAALVQVSRDEHSSLSPSSGDTFRIDALALPVIIGANPPERLSKQIVTTSISFYFATSTDSSELKPIEFLHADVVQRLTDHISSTSFITLEAFVTSVARVACFFNGCDHVSVTAEKPSAVAFGAASGVTVSRSRANFGGV